MNCRERGFGTGSAAISDPIDVSDSFRYHPEGLAYLKRPADSHERCVHLAIQAWTAEGQFCDERSSDHVSCSLNSFKGGYI